MHMYTIASANILHTILVIKSKDVKALECHSIHGIIIENR